MLTAAKSTMLRIIREEKGAEGIEKILILAAVALPLLGVLLYFSGNIREWITEHWNSVVGTGASENPMDNNDPF